MGLRITLEVSLHRYGLSHERLLHHQRSEDEMADEHCKREDYDSGVRSNLASLHIGEILEVHSPHHER